MAARWRNSIVAMLVMLAATTFVVKELRWTDAITHFLAPGHDPQLAEISRGLADSELSRQMSFLVSAPDTSVAARASDDFVVFLQEQPEIKELRHHWKNEIGSEIHKIYFPRRLQLWSENPEKEIPAALELGALRKRIQRLKEELGGPRSFWIKGLATEDPLLLSSEIYRRLEKQNQQGVEVREGRLVASDGSWLVLATTHSSPFDSQNQSLLQLAIEEKINELRGAYGDGLSIRQSALSRFALKAEKDIRSDIQRISIASSVALSLLLLFLFGSLRVLLLIALPVLSGVLLGSAACLLVFGQIHGLTLAFGASLIGIAIDYPIHLINHHWGTAPKNRGSVLSKIRPGLFLGACTSIVGFAGLGWTSFPGIREIAFFTSVGLFAALCVTLLVLPHWLPSKPRHGFLYRVAHRGAARYLDLFKGVAKARRRSAYVVATFLIGLLCVVAPYVEFSDDVSKLSPLDPEIKNEDEAVRSQLSPMDAGRVFVAMADDVEGALQLNDRLHQRLIELRSNGKIEDFRSLHSFLWSKELQQRNAAVVLQQDDFVGRLANALRGEGFRPELFADAYRNPALLDEQNSLVPQDLKDSSLAPVIRSHLTQVGERFAVLTFIRSAAGATFADLQETANRISGVFLVDQKAMMENSYRENRQQTSQLLGLGLVAVFGVIFLRYRRFKLACAAFFPAVIAGAFALIVAWWATGPLNLLHLVSVILVLSMGVDYGVFLAESSASEDERTLTLMSLAFACLSTVLAFGALGLSPNPALRAIGVTCGLGVAFSFFMAPLASSLALGRASKPAGGRP